MKKFSLKLKPPQSKQQRNEARRRGTIQPLVRTRQRQEPQHGRQRGHTKAATSVRRAPSEFAARHEPKPGELLRAPSRRPQAREQPKTR